MFESAMNVVNLYQKALSFLLLNLGQLVFLVAPKIQIAAGQDSFALVSCLGVILKP